MRRDQGIIDDPELANRARLCAEPSATREVRRKNGALEITPRRTGQKFGKCGRCRDGWGAHALPGTTRSRGRLQNKPVVRVRAECQRITGLTNCRKSIAAKNFHWNTAGEFCEIEFCWLSKAGQIHHH